MTPRLRFHDAAVAPLWSGLDLEVEPGEWLTVLGPNGAGKSTLLATVLGTRALTHGSVEVPGRVGFVPQQRLFPSELPLRARDLVSLSLAHGVFTHRSPSKAAVDELMASVGAERFADQRVGTLSGGQQQLIRQAQALADDPTLLLADEPLLSLDLARQEQTVAMMEKRRQEAGTAVVFVTHSVNPVLSVTDRVLYIAPRGHVLGTVDDVMRTEVLSELYGTHVEVATVNGKLVVL